MIRRSLEPITHFLTGACMARTGFNRRTALATATMTLAAEAPDIDVLGRIRGPVFAFGHHRGFTHSRHVGYGKNHRHAMHAKVAR